jgi:hypothetical protein
MKLGVNFLFGLLLTVSGWCQSTGTAETAGPCSPAVTGSHNQFTISCRGLTRKQGEEFLRILNKISRNQLDPDLVLSKLDEIQSGVSSIKGELSLKQEQAAQAEKMRQTPPLLSAYLIPVSAHKVNLCINSANLIPYQYRYMITDSKGTILGGFPLSMETVYPKKERPSFCMQKDIDLASIPDHYIELDFIFKSLSYDELQMPGHAGTIAYKYSIADDASSLNLIP